MSNQEHHSRHGFTPGLPDHESVPKTDLTELDPKTIMLRTWQTERLMRTYADFLSSRRYGPASRFFVTDLYGVRKFRQRNYDIEYMYKLMRRFIPDILLVLVRNAIEVYHLTDELDQELLNVMIANLGVKDEITEEIYAEAYRMCDNYAERQRQIELLLEIGRQVDLSTHFPPIGLALRLARGPAYHAGWDELHDFLERGYKAFKHMGSAKKFLEAIRTREYRILDRIYASHPDPFSLAE